MTAPVEYWATEEIPGIAWDPDAEPPDDDTFNLNPVINP